jgi:hypothetical protein
MDKFDKILLEIDKILNGITYLINKFDINNKEISEFVINKLKSYDFDGDNIVDIHHNDNLIHNITIKRYSDILYYSIRFENNNGFWSYRYLSDYYITDINGEIIEEY